MRLPNKITTFNDSILSKFAPILQILENGDANAFELYNRVKTETGNIDEFVVTLDCLYALGKIDFIKEERIIRYVGNVS